MFDPASGRFVGYRGVARLPYRHETAARSSASDQLRQLVHELRTPANAVAGFAELIESQLLGPVSDVYRARAAAIRSQAAGLLSAIDDLDTAARIEGRALDLRATIVPVRPLLERVVRDLTPLAAERGATLVIVGEGAVSADDRAVERLLARMLAALLSAARPGERIGVSVESDGARVQIVADRPDALADLTGDALFTLDGRVGEDEPGVPLLGAGFTLRLVRNLAVELGGALDILPGRLTVRLPAGEDRPADQVASH
jgi:signal transduction histidine kinase